MSLVNIHLSGFVEEAITGSVTGSTARDVLNIPTSIATEQFINSSPLHTKSSTILNSNIFKDVWIGHPAVETNFGGKGAQFTDIIEFATPVENMAKTPELSAGWNLFAYMLPYEQDTSDTLRAHYGRKDAEEFSGGPLAPFYGSDATAASASFIKSNFTGPGQEESGTWGSSAYRPGAIWEFNIGGTAYRFLLKGSDPGELFAIQENIGSISLYTLNFQQYEDDSQQYQSFIIGMQFIVNNLTVANSLQTLGFGVQASIIFTPTNTLATGGLKFTMDAIGSTHNVNTIKVFIPKQNWSGETGLEADHGLPFDPSYENPPSTWIPFQNNQVVFSFGFNGGTESSIKYGEHIPAYIADNSNTNAPWHTIVPAPSDPYAAIGTGVDTHFAIVKDFLGAAYIPNFGFNGIGNFIPGSAYQIKVLAPYTLREWPKANLVRTPAVDLYKTRDPAPIKFPLISNENKELAGDLIKYIKAMDNVRIDLPTGWSFIGWNRIYDTTSGLFNELNNCTFRSIASHGGGFAKEIFHDPTVLPGSITIQAAVESSHLVLGTGTSFTSDYSPGDIFKFDAVLGPLPAGPIQKLQSSVLSVLSDAQLTISLVSNIQDVTPLTTNYYYKDQEVTNASIVDSVIIMKNNNGAVLIPEFDFDGIDIMHAGEGFQIKTLEAINGFAWRIHENISTGLLPTE